MNRNILSEYVMYHVQSGAAVEQGGLARDGLLIPWQFPPQPGLHGGTSHGCPRSLLGFVLALTCY